MADNQHPGTDVFDRDAEHHAGYIYTTIDKPSSRMATQRSTDTILKLGRFEGRGILDVGCGDGFYAIRFWDQGRPSRMVGIDVAQKAVEAANANKGDRGIEFQVADAHRLPFADDSFDVVMLQSILHHDDDPVLSVREAFRVASEVLIHEPNGLNLGLKVIEKVSPYHREHSERSYTPRKLRHWVSEAGGNVIRHGFAGFVPMFCPDRLAKAMKSVEPLIEHTPILCPLGCAVYVLVARRKD